MNIRLYTADQLITEADTESDNAVGSDVLVANLAFKVGYMQGQIRRLVALRDELTGDRNIVQEVENIRMKLGD